MKNRRLSYFLALIGIVTIIVLDRSMVSKLPEGYRFHKVMSNCVAIVYDRKYIYRNGVRTNLLVGPNVKEYNVCGGCIVGYVEGCQADCGLILSNINPSTGYFLIEINSGNAVDGLTKKDWLLLLKTKGIKYIPKLRSRYVLAW